MMRSRRQSIRLSLGIGGRSRPKARSARSPQLFGAVGMRSERRSGQKLWQKLRAPLQILGALAVLLVINLYVLYYRHGTSLPALLKQAETGRALSARLSGPVGTPPQPSRPMRKPKVLPPLPDYPRVVEQPLHASDTLSEVLTKVAVPQRQKLELESTLQGVLDPGGLGPGQSLTFFYDHEDRLQAVDYRLTESLAYHLERVQTGSADRFVPVKQTQPLVLSTQRIEIKLEAKSDLVAAVQRAGEAPALAARLYEVLACEFNLYSDAQAGDRLRLLVEKQHLGERFYRYGRLLAVEYVPATGGARTRRLRAFLRTESSPPNAGASPGAGQLYFGDSGDSISRSFCKAPILWSRSSRPMQSSHPILQGDRGRYLLDYQTEAAVPVVAIGAGKVKLVPGRAGKPQTVIVSHPGGIESSYGPLGRLARGLVDGQSVRQRQILGYVATAPGHELSHLRLQVRVGGRAVDPSKLKSSREPGVPDGERAAFIAQSNEWAEKLARSDEPVIAIRGGESR